MGISTTAGSTSLNLPKWLQAGLLNNQSKSKQDYAKNIPSSMRPGKPLATNLATIMEIVLLCTQEHLFPQLFMTYIHNIVK